MFITLSSSASAQYPTNGIGGATTTVTSSMYSPPTFTISGLPLDTETVTIPGYSAGPFSTNVFNTLVFEFDSNATTTAGNIAVTIGASAAATADNLVAAINARADCGFTATSDGTSQVWLVPKVETRAAVVTLAEAATNVTAFSPTNLRYLRRIRVLGFQPRNSAAAATGSVAIAAHAGATFLTQPSSTAGTETLPYQPIGPGGVVLPGYGLKVTASAANIVGTLFFEEE